MKRFLRLFLFLCAAAFAGGPAGAEPLRVRDVLAMEGAALDGIALPPAVMTVRDVCLYRSCPGGVYTVIGRGPEKSDS